MERKKTLKPVTVAKMIRFIDQVAKNIEEGKIFSMDKLTREKSVASGSGSIMVEMNYISYDGRKYSFVDDRPFPVDRKTAVYILEGIRKKNISYNKENIKEVIQQTAETTIATFKASGEDNYRNTVESLPFKEKSLKSPELGLILEKLTNHLIESNKKDIFDGIKTTYDERVKVASSVAAGVYGSCGSDFARMSESAIQDINEKIMFVADDILNKCQNFKKILNT